MHPCNRCEKSKQECKYNYISDTQIEHAAREIEEARMLLRREGNTEPHILRTDRDDIHFWRNFAQSLEIDNKRLQAISDILTKQLEQHQ